VWSGEGAVSATDGVKLSSLETGISNECCKGKSYVLFTAGTSLTYDK
jgi:hypothetical protein